MKKLRVVLLSIWVVFSSCSHSGPLTRPSGSIESGDVVVLATADFHATMERAEALAVNLRELQKQYQGKSLSFMAGDFFQGSLEGNSSKGKAVIDFLNLLNLDAVSMGNHDIDYGPARPGSIVPRKGEHPRGAMNARVRESRFPWLAANVRYKRGRAPQQQPFGKSATGRLAGSATHFRNARGERTLFPPHMVTEVNGYRIGIVGAITEKTPHITLPAFVDDLEFLPLKQAVEDEARFLREDRRCDLVLLLAHAGLLCNPDTGRCLEEGDNAELLYLLRALKPGTIDAAIGGHTHQKADEVINGTPVIEAPAYGRAVSVLHLLLSREAGGGRAHVEKAWAEHIETPKQVSADSAPDVSTAMAPYRESVDKIKNKTVGTIGGKFDGARFAENALGNMIADAFREGAKNLNHRAKVGLMNNGGVRAPLIGPSISYGDVYRTLPFQNHLAVIKVRGEQLLRIVEIGVSGSHGVSGFSGLEVTALKVPQNLEGPWDRDLNGDGKKEQWERDLVEKVDIVETTTDGVVKRSPLDPAAVYTLATMDYLYFGGDHLGIVFRDVPSADAIIFYDKPARDVLAEFITNHSGQMHPDQFYLPSRPRVIWIEPQQ